MIVVSEMPLVACFCLCHRDPLGDFRSLFHQGRYTEAMRLGDRISTNWGGVDVKDILEAAAACKDCLDQHCPALREERRPKRRKAVWIDPPLMLPPPEQFPPDPPDNDGEDGG